MLTYQGIITKKEFVAELKHHQEMDNFVRGTYSGDEDGKFIGCAVGCSLESIARTKKLNLNYSDHSKYPELLGIPEWLARVEDTIFENINEERSKSWPVEFAEAIPENVDLETVKAKFLICVLDKALTTFDHNKFPDVKKSIDDVKSLWVDGGTEQEFRDAAAYAVRAAADAADAADAAAYAADAAADAARAAAYAADAAADAARAAADAARAATMEYFADELLKMLRECKEKISESK